MVAVGAREAIKIEEKNFELKELCLCFQPSVVSPPRIEGTFLFGLEKKLCVASLSNFEKVERNN